jgi:hypothetical protein
LDRTQRIEGVELDANSQQTVFLHQRAILQTAKLALNEDAATVQQTTSPIDGLKGFTLPISLDASEIQNVTAQNNPALDVAGGTFWSPLNSAAGTLSNCKFVGTVKANPGVGTTDTANRTFHLLIRRYTDDTMTAYSDDGPLWQFTGELEEQPELDISFDFTLLNITPDEVLAFVFFETTADVFGFFTVEFTEIDISVEFIQNFDSTTAQGYFLHEAAQRITEVITDTQAQFKSNLFGRTDIGYAQNGIASKRTVHKGLQVRGFPNAAPSISFRNFFDSVNAMENIGAGIEYDSLNRPLLRIEEKEFFFSGEVIGTVYDVAKLKKKVAREWIYNAVQVGYQKSEYEEVNGLREHNNKFDWSTYISTIKNEYKIVSVIRADGYGIEFARRKPYSLFPSEDTQYDNDNFIVVVREVGPNWHAAKDEDYDSVLNIFDPESAYNLDLSPGRMLRKHGMMLRSGLEKYLSEEIKFNFAEQASNMVSTRTGESAIDENADIVNNTLNYGRWLPEIYSFESELGPQLLKTIMRNPYGIIKFSTNSQDKTTQYFYGWILEVEGNEEDNKADWELLRVNTSSPDVELIDPEGNVPSEGVPPPEELYGYEGTFDFLFIG